MSRITGKINLMNLHAVRKTINGQMGPLECVVIPIEKNNLFVGDKGIYLDIIAFDVENRKADSRDTHLIKQSLGKEIREKMTEEQKKAMPVLGNLQVWGASTEREPVSSLDLLPDSDDLPY